MATETSFFTDAETGAIAAQLPYLRRFSRALAGGQSRGDALAAAALEALLTDRAPIDASPTVRAGLFRALIEIWRGSTQAAAETVADVFTDPARGRLEALDADARAALLLIEMENLSEAEAAAALDMDEGSLAETHTAARAALKGMPRVKVLIIEDEPIILMDLTSIVEGLGHEVVDTADTASDAVARAAEHEPDLILTDVQLADGSSGIDAIKTITEQITPPVIFITAYPDRLLTGDRPEPTYLISKPFQISAVEAAIAQAVYFGQKPVS